MQAVSEPGMVAKSRDIGGAFFEVAVEYEVREPYRSCSACEARLHVRHLEPRDVATGRRVII
jgi:hypothetical protein